MIKVKRRVVRETGETDQRTGKPIAIALEVGGRVIKLWAKGNRTAYTVSVKQIWIAGAYNAAQDIKRRKLEAKEERKRQRKEG